MATIRRLSDDDVRSIFESLHHNKPTPPHLKFMIVPVGSNGLKLSPPSYEFEDGLYVLLRPLKKKKANSRSNSSADIPQPPPHLKHLILRESLPETCPWSLSGPQFPQPTAIQQRYCYPKGRTEYSSRKGGALWTMYGANQKEDLEYRLLHVYFSAKRAVNKGLTVLDEELAAVVASPAKRSKRSPNRFMNVTTPNSQKSQLSLFRSNSQSSITSHYSSCFDKQATFDNATMTTPVTAPLSESVNSPYSLPSTQHTYSPMDQPSLQPLWNVDNGYNRTTVSPSDYAFNAFYPVGDEQLDLDDSIVYKTSKTKRRLGLDSIPESPDRKRVKRAVDQDTEPNLSYKSSFDENLLRNSDADTGGHNVDWDVFLNEPLLSFSTNPSSDEGDRDKGVDDTLDHDFTKIENQVLTHPDQVDHEQLMQKLDLVHGELKQILSSVETPERQGQLCCILSDWARTVARDPLGNSCVKQMWSYTDQVN